MLLAADRYVPEFVLAKFEAHNETTKTQTGEFSFTVLDLHFKRNAGFYLTTYVSTAMLVIVSWLGFFVNAKNQTLKSGISLFSLCTLALTLTIFEKDLSRLSYTTAMDLWTGTCLMFIFAALVESVVVHHRNNGHGSKPENESNKSFELTDKSVSNNWTVWIKVLF